MNKTHRQTAVAWVLSICLLPLAVFAQEPNTVNLEIMAPNSRPFGQSYAMWHANYWRWAFAQPTDRSPLIDTTGAFGAQGQAGDVWFLGASPVGLSFVRNYTIPAGKALMVPVAYWTWIVTPYNHPEDWTPGGWRPGMPHLEQDLTWFLENEYDGLGGTGARPGMYAAFNTITNVSCEIDGKPVENLAQYRAASPPFTIQVPENNVLDIWCGVQAPAGEYGPCCDDGIYLILAPLPAGEHQIHVHAELPDGGLVLDLTYLLTITPEVK